MNGFRDIELLSSYLDGQLSPSDSARLESRLTSDPELASAFNDLRAVRGILRKLPARKAPRNFMLTRKMVGIKPPMPPAYSFFRFSSAFATLLLVLTFAFNAIVPRISFGFGGAAAPATEYGVGGGGPGMGGGDDFAAQQAPAATEAPAATDALAFAEPLPELSVIPTQVAPSAADGSARDMPTPTPEVASSKEAATPSVLVDQPVSQEDATLWFSSWEIGLLVIGLLSAAIAFVIGQSAKRKWR